MKCCMNNYIYSLSFKGKGGGGGGGGGGKNFFPEKEGSIRKGMLVRDGRLYRGLYYFYFYFIADHYFEF